MQQPKRGEVRGCCVLWCTNPSSHYNVPHSERKPSDCGDTSRVSASLASLQEKGQKPQSCGSSRSCQRMIWRSEGTERTQRSGAGAVINPLVVAASLWAAKDVAVIPN